MQSKTILQDDFIAVMETVSKMLNCTPTVTMGTACKLLAGVQVDQSSDIDLIVPGDSVMMSAVKSTISPCGTYSGKKKIIEVLGFKVELLADFRVTVKGQTRHFGQTMAIVAVPYADTMWTAAVTPSRDLRWFYEGMNRPKDQEKIQLLDSILS